MNYDPLLDYEAKGQIDGEAGNKDFDIYADMNSEEARLYRKGYREGYWKTHAPDPSPEQLAASLRGEKAPAQAEALEPRLDQPPASAEPPERMDEPPTPVTKKEKPKPRSPKPHQDQLGFL